MKPHPLDPRYRGNPFPNPHESNDPSRNLFGASNQSISNPPCSNTLTPSDVGLKVMECKDYATAIAYINGLPQDQQQKCRGSIINPLAFKVREELLKFKQLPDAFKFINTLPQYLQMKLKDDKVIEYYFLKKLTEQDGYFGKIEFVRSLMNDSTLTEEWKIFLKTLLQTTDFKEVFVTAADKMMTEYENYYDAKKFIDTLPDEIQMKEEVRSILIKYARKYIINEGNDTDVANFLSNLPDDIKNSEQIVDAFVTRTINKIRACEDYQDKLAVFNFAITLMPNIADNVWILPELEIHISNQIMLVEIYSDLESFLNNLPAAIRNGEQIVNAFVTRTINKMNGCQSLSAAMAVFNFAITLMPAIENDENIIAILDRFSVAYP